jgi:RING finger protein 121/175
MCIIEDPIFLYSWIIFDVYLLYLAKVAFGFHTDKNAPKAVYRSFKRIFTVTNHATVVSQLLTLLFFFIESNYMLISLRGMVYSIYFAVLSREVVRSLSLLMAQTTGYYSKEGVPGRTDTSSRCMVCTGDLDGETVTLSCGHMYHRDCIMGYCIIGNNSHCQFCKHGVDNKIFEQDYWIKSELFIRPLMNTMRSCISFFIVMMCCYAWKRNSVQ